MYKSQIFILYKQQYNRIGRLALNSNVRKNDSNIFEVVNGPIDVSHASF